MVATDERDVNGCVKDFGSEQDVFAVCEEAEDSDLPDTVLRWMIYPMTAEEFYEDVWGKRPPLIRRPHHREFFRNILGKADVERLLQCKRLNYGTNIDVTKYQRGVDGMGVRETRNLKGIAASDKVIHEAMQICDW